MVKQSNKISGNTIELKPCPFCGSTAILIECMFSYAITCSKCNIYITATTKKPAIKKWNRRTNSEHMSKDREDQVKWLVKCVEALSQKVDRDYDKHDKLLKKDSSYGI